MAGAPWPQDNPASYDRITLGARRWPGLATVKVKRGQKIDKKEAKGQHSSKLTFNGRESAEVDITIILWDPAEFDEFQEALSEIEPEAGKKDPTPLDIGHPIATMRGVKAVAIHKIEGPDWDADKGWLVLKITALEFEPPPPQNATQTPSAATGYGFGTASFGKGDATDEGKLFQGGGNTSKPFEPPDDTDP